MLMPSLPPVMTLSEITALVTAGPAIALTLELPITILKPVIVSPSVLPMLNTLFSLSLIKVAPLPMKVALAPSSPTAKPS